MLKNKFYLARRNNGFYYIGWLKDERRVWQSTKCRRKSDANNFLKTFDVEKETTVNHTLTSILEIYKTYRSIRIKTLNSYELSIKMFTGAIGDKSISDYTNEDIERFKQHCIERGLTMFTINVYFRSIRAMFNLAVKLRLINESPMRLFQLIKIVKRTPVYLTKEQVKTLFEKVDCQHISDIIAFALYTGCRRGEILNLKWENIDLVKKQFTVANDVDFQTKSGQQRTLPLHSVVVEILNRLYKENKVYVFSKSNGYKYDGSYISARFKEYCKTAKLPTNIHFHNLRHSFATSLVSSGVDIYSVSKLLGHSSIVTTQIYATVAPSALSASINTLKF